MNTVSIVVPMYRTAATAIELHRRLSDAVDGWDRAEFIYVDDACDDGSAEAISSLKTLDPRVVAVRHTSNRGQHQAIRSGLRHTTGESVVVLDADLQDPPEAIPALLSYLHASDFDAVFAGRTGQYEGRIRLATGRLFKCLLARVAQTPIDAGGYVAMKRLMVDDLLAQSRKSPYLLADVAATGRPITSIPVVRQERAVGNSATSSLTRLRLGFSALNTAWGTRKK